MKSVYEYLQNKHIYGNDYIGPYIKEERRFSVYQKRTHTYTPFWSRTHITVPVLLTVIKEHNKNLYKNLLQNYPEFLI